MFEHLLDASLIRLHANNFVDSKQIVDQLSNVLLDETLDDSSVALCNSKIFNSDMSLFLFLEKHAGLKDNLTAQVRKGIFRMLASYVKLRKLKIFEYIELIYRNCILIFKKEESNQAKETALNPICKIIKHIDTRDTLAAIIQPQVTVKILLDEIKFNKPTQKVKGSVWNLLGLLFYYFRENLTEDIKVEVQTVCFKELQEQMKSAKPEVSYIAGMFKSFRYSLREIFLTQKEVGELFQMAKFAIIPIKEIRQYSVIINSLKVIGIHAQVFKDMILENAQSLLDQLLALISHENKEVKWNASDCLECVMSLLAQELDKSYKYHEKSFNYIIQKMYSLVQQQQQSIYFASITVIIKSIGIFSKAIAKHLGQQQLSIFFRQMIQLSETRLLKHIEKDGVNAITDFAPAEEDNVKKGTSFKTILYRQKQVISFVSSFASIVNELSVLKQEESSHLLSLCLVGFKQFSSFYEKYKLPLVLSLVNLIKAMKKHSDVYILWIDNLITTGIVESIKLPANAYLSMLEYYDTLKSCCYFWKEMFNCVNWTDESLSDFASKFFIHFLKVMENSDLGYAVIYKSLLDNDNQEIEKQDNNSQVAKIQEIIGEVQQVQYVANNEVELQFFYRLTLLFDGVLGSIKTSLFSNYVYEFYKSIILRLRKLPRSIVLLKLLRCINEYLENNNLLRHLKHSTRKDIISQIKIYFNELYKNLGKYQDELLVDSIKALLSVPFEVLQADNYTFLKSSLIIGLKKGFELGQQNISLGYASIECLSRIVKKTKNNKSIDKYLKLVIPYLSNYLSITRNQLEIITSNRSNNTNTASSNKNKQQQLLQQEQDVIINQDTFNLTLSELTQKKSILVERVLDLLGQLGGEAHLIVLNDKAGKSEANGKSEGIEQKLKNEFEHLQIASNQQKIISWDYEAQLIFPLPLLAKKLDLNLTKLLPRIVELTAHPEDKIKVYACESIHSLTIYMIGQQASSICKSTVLIVFINILDSFRGRAKEERERYGYYDQVQRIILQNLCQAIPNNIHHWKLLNQLIIQISRWFANSKQLESPEISVLLDSIMDFISSKDNNNLRELAANCLGQFIKWTIKQNSEQEIKLNHSNIKSTLRRIQSFAGQPDPSKRFGALLALKELVNHTKGESFLVDKFIMETVSTGTKIAQKTSTSTEVEDNFGILVKLQSQIIQKYSVTLRQENPARSGQFKKLDQLLSWLYDVGFFDKSHLVRKSSFELWQAILGGKGSPMNCKQFLESKIEKKRLFNNNNSTILDFKLSSANQSSYFLSLQQLLAQIHVWTQILQNKQLTCKELFKYQDFEQVFCFNVESFLKSLSGIQQRYQKSDGYLVELLLEDAVDLQYIENEMQSVIVTIENISDFIFLLSNNVIELQTFLLFLPDIPLDVLYHLFLQIILKPNYLLPGLNVDIFLTRSDQFFAKMSNLFKSIIQLCPNNVDFFKEHVLKVLSLLFRDYKPRQPFQDLLNDENSLKENELKVFLDGMRILFQFCQPSSLYTQQFVEQAINGILFSVKSMEEILLQKPDSLFKESRTQMMFQFALDISSQATNKFILDTVSSQSQFFQKYENPLLNYVKSKWVAVGKDFMAVAKTNISLLRLSVPLAQSLGHTCVDTLTAVLPTWKGYGRQDEGFLQLELRLNWILLSFCDSVKPNLEKNQDGKILLQAFINIQDIKSKEDLDIYYVYLEQLILESMNLKLPLVVQEQSLSLLGLYSRTSSKGGFTNQREIKLALGDLRAKYFPVRVRELKRDSREEVEFRTILQSLLDMMILSGRIELLEFIFPILREALPKSYDHKLKIFLKRFIADNFINSSVDMQVAGMRWAFNQFMDKELDRSLIECARYEVVQKILLNLLETAKDQSVIDWTVEVAKQLQSIIENTNFLKEQSVKEVVRWSIELTMVFKIFESIYKRISGDKIKDIVHKRIYGDNTQGNELSKSIIKVTYNYRKSQYERYDYVRDSQKNSPDLIAIDTALILRQMHCAAYNCLARVIVATQSKENVWNQFIFLVKNDLLWSLLVDNEQKEFAFEVHTNFQEQSYHKTKLLLSSIPALSTKQIIAKKYLTDTLLCTFNKPTSASQAFLPSNPTKSDGEVDQTEEEDKDDFYGDDEDQNQKGLKKNSTIEMDSINKHPCMSTILEVIDQMIEKFPCPEGVMPQWMGLLLEEVKKESCSLSARILIIKIVINKAAIFEKFSAQWFDVLVDYSKLKDNGAKFFHYYLRDVCTTLIDWCSKKPNLVSKRQLTADKKQNLCSVINKLCRVLAHKEREIFRQNVAIIKALCEYWKECIFIDEKQITQMLLLAEGGEGDKEQVELWNLNAVVVMDFCLYYRLPILTNYEHYARAQSMEEKHTFFINLHTKDRFKKLLSLLNHHKKHFCKATATVCGGLLSFMREQGGAFEEKRKAYEQEIVRSCINLLMKSDKTSKERFPLVIACITQGYPDFLSNIGIMVQCQDYIGQKTKSDRAYILSAMFAFLEKKFDKRENIKDEIHKVCTSFRGNIQNIISDENPENQEKFLSLLVFLTSPQIIAPFSDALALLKMSLPTLKSKYERHYIEKYATAYYTIIFNLYDHLINTNDQIPVVPDLIEEDGFKQQIKACVLTGLTSQHLQIREKTFGFLDRETNDSKTPYERLLFLIKEIYQPEQERLWLLSAVPLILCLSKRTSDYSKNLFDEQLSKVARFYDWDFRDSVNMKLYNSSQPLTPLFTLSQVTTTIDAQGFAIPAPRKLKNMTNISQIPMQEGVRATVASQEELQSQSDIKRQYYQEQLSRMKQANSISPSPQPSASQFQSSRNPFMFSFSQNLMPISEDIEEIQDNKEANKNAENSRIDIFKSEINRTNKNKDLSKFFSSHNMSFTQVNINQQKLLRFQEENDGKTLTKQDDIRKRQEQLFLQNQDKWRKNQLQTIRKYKIGELPDISIQYKDIIDPLMALSFVDETLAGGLFQLLVHGMFKEEESQDRQKKLKDILSTLLGKSVVFDFNFVSSIHKTMLMLCKEGELFESTLIRESGLHSHSYYTAIVLLEESLFTLFNQRDQGNDNDVLIRGRGKRIRKNLNAQQRALLDDDEIEEIQDKEEKEKNNEEEQKKRIEVGYWMDLIDIYAQVGEKDAIKGILKKAVSGPETSDVVLALDLKFAGQISNSERILKEVVGKAARENQQMQALDDRIHKYIRSEYHDTLALLGKWDELANELINLNQDNMRNPEQIGTEQMKMIMLSLMQSDTTESGRWGDLKEYVKMWTSSEWGKSALEGPLSYEMSLITIIDGDIDRTRYFHKLSVDEFLKVWSNFGSFASASKHEHLSFIYKNYELKEYLTIDGKIEVALDDFTNLFKNWQARQPSQAFDSQICWDQILNSREIFALALFSKYNLEKEQINKIRANWYIQNVKGMLKKGIYGAADRKMIKATRFRRVTEGLAEFNWEFYKITAKLKLKQLEVDLKNDQLPDNPKEKFNKLLKLFDNEKKKYEKQLSQLQLAKFSFLNIQVHEKFIDVYNDYALTQQVFFISIFSYFTFLLSNQVEKRFLDEYALVISNIYTDYFQLFQKDIMKQFIEQAQNQATFENTFTFRGTASLPASEGIMNLRDVKPEEVILFRRKVYQRFANFCEQLLRIIESESREQLKVSLKNDYQLSLETVGLAFLEYTLKCFALFGGGGGASKGDSKHEMVIEGEQRKSTDNPNSQANRQEIDSSMGNLVLKMLRIIQKLPQQTGKMFRSAVEDQIIPCWAFISYLPQMLHVVKKQSLAEVFAPLLTKLAQNYPAALLYQFNTLFSSKRSCETILSQEIFDYLHNSLPSYFELIRQFNSLTHPEHRLIYHIENLKNTFVHYQKISKTAAGASKSAKEEMQKAIDAVVDEMYSDVFGARPETVGSYNSKFAKDHYPSFKKLKKAYFGIADANDQIRKEAYDLIKISRDKVNTKDLKSGYDKLANFSQFLADFQGDSDIEIPGQYSHSSAIIEPYKESHIKIQSFDTQILTLQSIRRPKRLTVFGSDEKSYQVRQQQQKLLSQCFFGQFLVKGIEDLRLDQRIEQLYSVMNGIFSGDPSCTAKELSLATFKIIPMTNILGLLEWVDKTSVLKEILNREYQEKKGIKEDISQDNEAIRMRKEWLKTLNRKGGLAEQHLSLQLLSQDLITENFEAQANLIPADLMRNALERLASSSETYLYLKDRFIRNYAVLCVAGYILGIGDRHLENFLVNYANGDIVSIDFGYSFGAGFGLAVPELMPFRLTRCFTNLMSPIGIDGIFRHSMISAMSALKRKRNILLEFCEVFINDPLVDWVKLTKDKKMGTFLFSEGIEHLDSAKNYQLEQSLAKEQSLKNNNTIDSTLMDNIIIHLQRIDIVKLKLIGMNPSLIATQELSSTRHKTEKYYDNLVQAVQGKQNSIRASFTNKQFLEVSEQVDCLIDLSVDPNIIGRVWIGWSPIV